MSGGGSLQPIGQSFVTMGTRMGGLAPRPSSPGYVAPSQLSQAPVYQPTQAAPQQMSPFVQQMMQQNMAPNPMVQQAVGLQAALQQLTGGMQNMPMMRGSMLMYQNPALGFRPNMVHSQEVLNRVAPSIYKKD